MLLKLKKTVRAVQKGDLWKRKMRSLASRLRKGRKTRDYTGAPIKQASLK
ncbi:MAG: hypothetical protein HYZ88_00270 [Candidatus Omnitrophica bacterium]|nr:hypothetical protein [Candidatus Omnitrophota bacterium]